VSKARRQSDSKGSGAGNGGHDEFWRLMTRYAPVIGLLPASVLAGYAIGYGLDYLFSTTFLRFVFMLLGVVSGVVQLIRILGNDINNDSK
jgi:putative F0F1-ATPase subunit (Ca2+/Mg2+ transporter)